ncbi:alcohol dehydrogenase catalytic domain-containing protein [Flavilitoribacter nigricans]|uniref:Zinc-binding dehydrogenase n=1 Tax=Flavilitoribacter nigricans (strain ATCC 23147 / DSM 23189 / NBRC 102662 / NCIMB 1420 / SS-2) TaxID=1122177 RepID=A0A2D0NES5_FLAN2|nr:zinc-binding dehydrogenase [Flavilitoribacter nigricans]PHN07011.1 zinc-binding dehydrogenase [Flavilitoribacter nigricans DSM 23189 = NBRC 102662]
MQRQVYLLKAGRLANLKLVTEELPAPQPDEVTVAVKAIGLNFADIFAIWGLYAATPEGIFTPGLEYAGEIAAVGSAVEGVKKGDRVMGVTRFGAYTSHLNINHRYVVPLPEDWDFVEGAAFLVHVLTAYYGLVKLGDLQQGQNVLIHSGGGGVGLMANRIAKKYNTFTIGTIGRPDKEALLREEGYDRVIVRSKQFADDLEQALDGRDLHLIMECIGGKILKIGFNQLAPMGRMISYGSARYASVGNRPNYLKLLYYYLTRPKIDPQTMTSENKSVMAFNLIFLFHKVDLMHEMLEEIGQLALKKPYVGHRLPFEKLEEAILLFQSGKTTGKVVLEV